MTESNQAPVTRLLAQWREGDETSESELFQTIYDELEHMAGRLLRSERGGHTLEPPSLVSECYLRLKGSDQNYVDRSHFFAVATRVMRRLLIDHARGRARAKRGGAWHQVTLLPELQQAPNDPVDILAFDQALQKLEGADARKAEFVQLRHIAGLSNGEIAELFGVSTRTVKRDLQFARAFIRHELEVASN